MLAAWQDVVATTCFLLIGTLLYRDMFVGGDYLPLPYGDWMAHEGMCFSNLHWCGRDKSPQPHLQTSPKHGTRPRRECRQIGLPFTPSCEFLESAARIRSRNGKS